MHVPADAGGPRPLPSPSRSLACADGDRAVYGYGPARGVVEVLAWHDGTARWSRSCTTSSRTKFEAATMVTLEALRASDEDGAQASCGLAVGATVQEDSGRLPSMRDEALRLAGVHRCRRRLRRHPCGQPDSARRAGRLRPIAPNEKLLPAGRCAPNQLHAVTDADLDIAILGGFVYQPDRPDHDAGQAAVRELRANVSTDRAADDALQLLFQPVVERVGTSMRIPGRGVPGAAAPALLTAPRCRRRRTRLRPGRSPGRSAPPGGVAWRRPGRGALSPRVH